ncbi:hypothetical protein BVRB_8g201280 [Beta vulgaris subsp. vulgaris]|uniref:Uncharacterized protein n=1 Tax=Beta vulgaris subsp. vulgaris TaxID=3555 RepID=A0A0J8B9U4_BETVV|nr:hypothetical protein BVRB_8g201280 [Beta vulgaris subsp. vulgaris]
MFISQVLEAVRETSFSLFLLCSSLTIVLMRDWTGASQVPHKPPWEPHSCVFPTVSVTGTSEEAEAAKIARSVASSSLVKAAVYGRDPNWGRIACAAGYATIPFNLNKLQISLGDIPHQKNSMAAAPHLHLFRSVFKPELICAILSSKPLTFLQIA